jgi:hypothetical protein
MMIICQKENCYALKFYLNKIISYKMSKKEIVIGIGIAVAAIVIVGIFTNMFDLARPGVEKAVNSTETLASNVTVQGKDVVSGIKSASSDVQNYTSQIKIKNLPP